MGMALAKAGRHVTVASGETNCPSTMFLPTAMRLKTILPCFSVAIKDTCWIFLFNLYMMYKILWKKTQDTECGCLYGCSVHVVVHRRPDLITDALWTHCFGQVLDLLFSAWMLEPIYPANKHLSQAPSVTAIAEETVPQMDDFNRNQVQVSHT